MSTRGRITIPRQFIFDLMVVKGSRYLFKMRKDGISITPVRPWEAKYDDVKEINRQEMLKQMKRGHQKAGA